MASLAESPVIIDVPIVSVACTRPERNDKHDFKAYPAALHFIQVGAERAKEGDAHRQAILHRIPEEKPLGLGVLILVFTEVLHHSQPEREHDQCWPDIYINCVVELSLLAQRLVRGYFKEWAVAALRGDMEVMVVGVELVHHQKPSRADVDEHKP